MKYGVTQGSVVSPLNFLIFFNDLYFVISDSTTFHLVTETCLLDSKQSLKEISKSASKDLKSLLYWHNVNKISLMLPKTK